jgi:hypothetical protein
MIDEYGVFGGMKSGRGKRSALRKPASVPKKIRITILEFQMSS